jgi:lipid II:glycine glycyltransferase (peptidoglycan interpeptide bridge formation enzyme)
MLPLTTKVITEKSTWEAFIATCPEANFLQSWNWGVFHSKLGKEVFYLGLFAGEEQVGAALAVREPAKRGAYLAVAGGPLIKGDQADQSTLWAAMISALRQQAQDAKCVFVRIRPQLIRTPETERLVSSLGLQLAPMHLTADLTIQLDLTQSADILLQNMRKNTRYEVRRVEKEGITVQMSQDPSLIERFYKDQLYLAEKHGFVPFSLPFLQEQFQAFVADDQVVLFDAYQGEKLLASAFIIFYNNEAVYHYGTSTPDNARLPGSYACQWAAIQEAQRRGCTRYNMWGIAPEDQPEHRFAGVSIFKRGFGGQEVEYVPAHDLQIAWQYGVTKGFELLRKKMRRL